MLTGPSVIARRAIAWVVDGVVLGVPYAAIHLALGSRGVIVGTVLAFIYWIVLEGGANGQTIGKRLTGVRVRGPGDTPLGYTRALVRNLVKCVFITYIWAFVRPDDRALHDLAADSTVVATD